MMHPEDDHSDSFPSLFIGKTYSYLEVTDSTNDRLKELVRMGKSIEGTVISAGFQTNGRGQRGAVWESGNSENILLSLLLNPGFVHIEDQFIISQVVAIAIRRCIQDTIPSADVKIKWPNDILVNEKKIAGVLIENILDGSIIKHCIIGVGINVNQEDILITATSVKKENGKMYNRSTIEKQLFPEIEKSYLTLKAGNKQDIKNEYLKNMYSINEERKFEDLNNGRIFNGIIKGVSNSGSLLITTDDNNQLEFQLKEIRFL